MKNNKHKKALLLIGVAEASKAVTADLDSDLGLFPSPITFIHDKNI